MVTPEDIAAAAKRIQGSLLRTPCTPSLALSEITGCEIVCKFENLQFTASYKERGALNRLLLHGCWADKGRKSRIGRGRTDKSHGEAAGGERERYATARPRPFRSQRVVRVVTLEHELPLVSCRELCVNLGDDG